MKTTYLGKISNVLRKGASTGLDVFDFANSLSATQLTSKEWLVKTLQTTTISRQFKSNNIEMMVVALARDSYSGSNGNSPITPGRDIF